MLMDKSSAKFRKNPRKTWYDNVAEVTASGDYQAVFSLKRPQPALLALLASGYSPIYPCHVSPAEMRTHPIGTGPFKFVEFKQNESIRLVRNPDYWKPGLPYLDGIEFTIVPNRSTAILAFIAGKFDITFPTEVTTQLLKDIKSQAPQAICEMKPTNVATNLIVNREKPPFDNAEVRRAMALALDRKAFIDILFEGQADIGGTMQPPPEGFWGMPPELLKTIPGYDPDVKKSRDEARKIMEKLGYGPGKRLKMKVSTRNIAVYRDPAVILIDQLKEVYIDGELDVVETRDLEKLFDQQSMETNLDKRRKLVWDIDKKLQEDVARPIIYHSRAGTCWQPQVKGVTVMVNSSYNGYRYEDLWLDR